MTHSQDIRGRVARAIFEGQSRRAAAQRFSVSASSAVRWAARAAEHGEPKAHKTGRPSGKGPLSDHLAFLVAAVEERPDMTMPELVDRLFKTLGVVAHAASLSRLLCRSGFTYKKTADGVGVRTR